MKIYLTGILLLLQTVVFAQSAGISGRVLDEHSQSLPAAAVVVLRVADSVKIKSLMTDSLGYFKGIDIPNGKYLICVHYMGYAPYYGKVFELTEFQKQYHYGELHLMPDTRMLNTIVVSGTPPLISQRLDRTVMNVEKSVMAEGNTALELLSKAPGVSVNENGEVSLKGRAGTSVMINGKLTYLSGSQLATLLRGTSSSAVSKIEIIANPSAGYDASGSGGIVNIILKKNVNSGFNGSVSANGGRGRSARYGSSTSFNYQKNKLNLYGSYDLTVHDYTVYMDVERNF
ncbi:carboxypeptidase regulatory-like domain-containing protein, partial [Pedobacter sp.]|uniref:carboxypeptidase regulatory-like domain-containing protein n=1 Tax=Pedobacter sp. TaxID=1411316 RepID=UPI002C1A8032